MRQEEVIDYLKAHKSIFAQEYGITTLGLYGSYARDEATQSSDVDIFYERDKSKPLKNGLDFLFLGDKIAKELKIDRVDFVKLSSMNPIIKYYAKRDFIYV